ncbi:fatty acyl-AMP ligase [Amycolatopsis samaneae]|uniref:Fatty acyl-AMP ligase n=1 Tax=Amycolatopsis samaneae TaxID=664691 RepID=A0ABW5GP82_9PSEU
MEGFLGGFTRAVAERPEAPAVVFRSGAGERTLTYAALHRAAGSTASWLRARSDRGDRVLLLFPSGLGFVTGLLGCLYAGVVPVPAPLPVGPAPQADRAAGIARDADAVIALTDKENLAAIAEVLAPLGVRCAVAGPGDGECAPEPGDPDRLAFLQYTSGSTSDPKGVLISHRNLAHNIALMRERLGWAAGTRFVSWLPMYHDMGLIALLLTPLAIGGTAIAMSPTDFLRRPVSWLELVHDHRAEVSCAPNFAYDLCARVITDERLAGLDLSCWRFACNGAEPIDAGTLDRFAARFGPFGFSPTSFVPGYGLAEATLFVSGARPGTGPVTCAVDPRSLERNVFAPVSGAGAVLVSSGRFDGVDLRIVEGGTGRVLRDGAVGEIWVRGDSVARGYWRRPEETERTFAARTDTGEGGFLRTGDLGVRRGDEIYLVGRAKETLVVRGRNLHPHDLERVVAALDHVFERLPCAVFSVRPDRDGQPGPEEIVVVQEVRVRGLSADEVRGLARKIKRGLTTRFGVPITAVLLVRLGQIRRTTSGKIRRGRMRELFLDGELAPLVVERQAGVASPAVARK